MSVFTSNYEAEPEDVPAESAAEESSPEIELAKAELNLKVALRTTKGEIERNRIEAEIQDLQTALHRYLKELSDNDSTYNELHCYHLTLSDLISDMQQVEHRLNRTCMFISNTIDPPEE